MRDFATKKAHKAQKEVAFNKFEKILFASINNLLINLNYEKQKISMKKKLINALKTLYNDKGLNQTELEELADIVGQNLTEESTETDINNAASGASGYVSFLQKVGNRYASAVENKYKGYVKPDENGKPSNVLTEERIAEMLNSKIAEAIKPFQDAEKAKHLNEVLMAQSKLKGIPQKFVSRYKLEDEQKAEELASQIEQDYAAERKEILTSLGLSDVPPIGGGNETSDEDFLKSMQDAQKALAPNS